MKTRISSSVYSYGPIVIHLVFIFMLFRLFNIFEKHQDNSNTMVSIIVLVAFWMVYSFFISKYRTVHFDDDYLYLRKFFKTQKIELSNIKEVSPKKSTSWELIIHEIKYIDDNMMLKTIEFFPSYSNFKALKLFKQRFQH